MEAEVGMGSAFLNLMCIKIPDDLIKIPNLIQWVWGRAQDFAFLTSF